MVLVYALPPPRQNPSSWCIYHLVRSLPPAMHTRSKVFRKRYLVCVHKHVCVCVFPSMGDGPSLIKARRVLHFAAYSGDYALQRIFSVPLDQLGSHRKGGKHWGFFVFSLTPYTLLRCLPHFFLFLVATRVHSVVDNEVEF